MKMKVNDKEKTTRDKRHDGLKVDFKNHKSNDKTPPRFENFAGRPTE